MRARTRHVLRSVIRDTIVGVALFLALPAMVHGLAPPKALWSVNEALAGEVIATRAVEVTSPAGAVAENALVAAAQMRPSEMPLQARRMNDFALLGLSLSLLVALNLAFLRHIRRVSVARRQDVGRC